MEKKKGGDDGEDQKGETYDCALKKTPSSQVRQVAYMSERTRSDEVVVGKMSKKGRKKRGGGQQQACSSSTRRQHARHHKT